MKSWSFHLQVFFLGHRAQQFLDLTNSPVSAILDRSIYEDAYIFSRALNHMGNLAERDYMAYRKLYELVVQNLPAPDLLIYLRAPVDLLMKRIQARARNIETGITREYLSVLESYYDDWLSNFDLCPVLTIQTDDLDFVHKPRTLDIIVERIHQKLAGKENLVF